MDSGKKSGKIGETDSTGKGKTEIFKSGVSGYSGIRREGELACLGNVRFTRSGIMEVRV